MSSEKINDYNQKLLAVLGTIVAIGFIFALIAGIAVFVSDFFFDRNYNSNRGLISDEQLSDMQKDSLIKQIISFDTPILIDTVNAVYLIPVVPKNLKNPERSQNFADRTETTLEYSSFKKGYGEYYAEYANMLLYNSPKNEIEKLFSKRILITSLETYYFKDDILIVFKGADKDNNQDGRIDSDDFSSLYVYSLNTKKMRIISQQESDIINYEFIENSKDLFVTLGIDRNKDGKYDYSYEPCEVKRYNFGTETLENIIPATLHNEVLKLVSGI